MSAIKNLKQSLTGFLARPAPKPDYPLNHYGIQSVPEDDLIGVFPQKAFGDRINFTDYENGRCTGTIDPKPEVGDLFAYELQSGLLMVFRIDKINHYGGRFGSHFNAQVTTYGMLREQAFPLKTLPRPRHN